MAMDRSYEGTAQSLVDRVRAVARVHPEKVARLSSPFDLFALGLQCDDLQPSLAQAGAALVLVQRELREAGHG